MKCVICKQGEVRPGNATVTLHRGPRTVIFKDVPARVRDDCGEYYLADDIAGELLKRAERADEEGVEVEIRRYATTQKQGPESTLWVGPRVGQRQIGSDSRETWQT